MAPPIFLVVTGRALIKAVGFRALSLMVAEFELILLRTSIVRKSQALRKFRITRQAPPIFKIRVHGGRTGLHANSAACLVKAIVTNLALDAFSFVIKFLACAIA